MGVKLLPKENESDMHIGFGLHDSLENPNTLFQSLCTYTCPRYFIRQLRHDKKQRGLVRDSSRQARIWLSWVKLPAGRKGILI